MKKILVSGLILVGLMAVVSGCNHKPKAVEANVTTDKNVTVEANKTEANATK